MGRGSLNFEKNTGFENQQAHFENTPQSIEIEETNARVWDGMKCFFKNPNFKPNFLKNKFQSFSHWIFSSNKYVVHKSQDIFKLGWSYQRHTH